MVGPFIIIREIKVRPFLNIKEIKARPFNTIRDIKLGPIHIRDKNRVRSVHAVELVPFSMEEKRVSHQGNM